MNYSHINRNSLMSNLYTDRPHHHLKPSEPWRPSAIDQPHLNPSKSKVNVRHSLNKTADPTSCTPHHRMPQYRHSCVETTQPTSTQSACSPPQPLQTHFLKASQKDHQISIDNLRKQNICNKTQPLPPTSQAQNRKKSQSLRVSSYNQLLPKWDEIKGFEPYDPRKSTASQEQASGSSLDEVKKQMAVLQRRVKLNEEQLSSLRDRQNTLPRLDKLANEVAKFNSQLFDYYKFNSNNFTQFQEKLQKQQRAITEVKGKIDGHFKDDSTKKQALIESRISELYEGFKHQEEFNKTQLTHKLSILERNLKHQIAEQGSTLRQQLLLQQKEHNTLKSKVIKLDQISQKNISEYKRSSKLCSKFISFETKETLSMREGDIFKDRTKSSINHETPRRDNDKLNRKDNIFEGKRQLIIKQRTYFIDSEGYLLDENKFYLLDGSNQQVKVAPHLLAVLQEHNMLALPMIH